MDNRDFCNIEFFYKFAEEGNYCGGFSEARMLKVLKGLAEYLDAALGDLIERIVLHPNSRLQSLHGRRETLKVSKNLWIPDPKGLGDL